MLFSAIFFGVFGYSAAQAADASEQDANKRKAAEDAYKKALESRKEAERAIEKSNKDIEAAKATLNAIKTETPDEASVKEATEKVKSATEDLKIKTDLKNAISGNKTGGATIEAGQENRTTPNETNPFFENWTVGLLVMKPKTRGISEASIDSGGVVRSNSVSTSETSLILARNFFPFRKNYKDDQKDNCSSSSLNDLLPEATQSFLSSFCMGAMVGVGFSTGSASSQFINFIGAGLAIGSPLADNSKFSWNVGIGIGRKFGHKTLDPSLTLDTKADPGVTQVTYRTSDVSAPFVYFSTKW